MIDSVVKELQKRKLNNIADVQALVGKASKRAYKKRQTSQAPQVAPTSQETPVEASKGLPGLQAELSETDAKIASLVGAQMGLQKIVAEGNNLPPERILKTEHLSLGIPVGVSHEEVKKMALMLLEFAATKMAEVVEAKAEGLAH
jgi:hypothetical protein